MSLSASHIAIQVAIVISLLLSAATASAQQTSEAVATAAEKAFNKGVEELAAGNHFGAITLLKTAVRFQPEKALYQHKLAKAFLAAEKYPDMWMHLRKATVLELSNEEYASDFLRMWKYHDLQGTLNVGSTDDGILKSMGEPDKRIENGRMKRWAYGFMAIDFGTGEEGKSKVFRVLDLRGYSTEADQEVEQVSVKIDSSKWKVAHHQVSRKNDNLELTLRDEQVQQWSELFSKQRFPLMSRTNATVDGMLSSLQAALKATNPNVEFTVISHSPTEVHYHWVTTSTNDNPAQHEVAKIIKGEKDFYRIAYVKKTNRLSEAELSKWMDIIGAAQLVPFANDAKQVPTQAKQTPISKNSKHQAWELGKSLSFAALIRGKHGPDDAVKKTLLTVSKNAQALNLEIPPPCKLTDDASADTATAIHFLLDSAGKTIYNSLQKKHSDEHSALFELATKSSILMLLYQPGDLTSQSLASAIERAAKKADLESEVWKPLVDKIQNQEAKAIVSEEIKQFQSRVAAAIR